MNVNRVAELDDEMAHVAALITDAGPGSRHHLLPRLHELVGAYARTGAGVPSQLRRLQEDLTNEAIEARFDNLPI